MAIREVLTSFTFEQQRVMINLIGTDVGDTSTLLTPTNTVVPALNEIVNGDVDLVNQTHGMDAGSLASPSLYWDAGQGFYKVDANKIGLTSGLAITGNLEVDGDITFRAGAGSGGTLTFGDLDTDNIVFNADVNSSIVPDTTANYNLGTATKQWNNIWIDGTASIDTLTVDENSTFTGYLQVDSGDVRVPSTQTTVDLFDDYATTVEAFGAGTAVRIGGTTGTLTLRNPTLVGTETTQNVYNTVATTVNAFGAATTINMGVAGGGGNTNFNILSDDLVCSGKITANGGELLSSENTFNLLINNGDVRIGNAAGTGTVTVLNKLALDGNLAINGTATYVELPDNQTNAFRFREGSNDYLQFRTENGLERVVVWKDLYVVGNLDVSGTQTVIDTTTLLVEDKNIELGATAAPSDATADGGGITLKATTDKTIAYNNTSGYWETNIGLKVAGVLEVSSSLDLTDSTIDLYSQTTNAASKTFQLFSDIGGTKVEKAFIQADGDAEFAGTITDKLSVDIRTVKINNSTGAETVNSTNYSSGEAIVAVGSGSVTFEGGASGLAAGSMITVVNDHSSAVTLTQGTGMTLAFTDGTTGNKTLAGYGVATILYITNSKAYISGTGVS